MTLLLTAQQCFFIVILAFAVVGFQRGWKRELVSLGFSLGAVLFLYLGGGSGMAQLIFVRLPIIAQVVAGTSGTSQAPTNGTVPTNIILLTTIITFIVVVAAGYLVGNRAFPKPATPQERLFGILPAIVGGYFMMLYVTYVVKSPLVTVGVDTPNQGQVGSYVLVIFVIAVVVVIAALIAANAKKPGGKK